MERNVCIPMHLDAFALSPDCCNGVSKIAPYTQPNYTALRLNTHLIQHDVLDHTDFHNTSSATKNPRLADLGVNPPDNLKRNRMGIHLHWSLPRFYRTATAQGGTPKSSDPPPDLEKDKTNPVFPPVPNRFLIIRHIKSTRPPGGPKQYQSWVVESDAIRKITEITDDSVDLESDVSPFVSYEGYPGHSDVLNAQTEIFLGQKLDLAGYSDSSSRNHTSLTLMNSSNPLFPDYALHNTNVFSIIDNFGYKLQNGDTAYLDNVICDYFVLGWHQKPKEDPLNQSIDPDPDLSSRLKNLKLQLSDAGQKTLGATQGTTRCLVYGAIYDVKFDKNQKPKNSLAEHNAGKFVNTMDESSDAKLGSQEKMEPLSIGTTPLDAILTFLEAHQDDANSIFEGGDARLASEIMEMSQFLYASADEYDARVQAQDLIAQQNFARADGGLKWTFAKPPLVAGGPPAVPDEVEALRLSALNEQQAKLDVCERKLRSLRWELFAEWWKYASEYKPLKQDQKREDAFKDAVNEIKKSIWGQDHNGGLQQEKLDLQNSLTELQQKVLVKSAAQDPFYTRSDPTLCIAGLNSGWPVDFLEAVTVKTHNELTSDTGSVDTIWQGAKNPVPTDHQLDQSAVRLLAEMMKNSVTQNGIDGQPKTTGFQAWGDRNPFAPLFIEWEAIYYHIDFKKWEVKVRPSPVGHAHSQVRYVPKETLADKAETNCKDYRIVSGRVLVLPQPVFSLENTVRELIDSQPPGLGTAINEKDQVDVLANIKDVKLISAKLSGLTNHLLTRVEGAHVKPLVRQQGGVTKVLQVAADVSSAIGIDADALALVQGESALTPYGDLMAFGKDQYPNAPFKALTHGQMVFRKLNIIDKFGQAICLPEMQRPRLRAPTELPTGKIFPCLSDYLAPDVDDVTGSLNTVFTTKNPKVPGKWPLCQFIQLTPSINQDARINAAFLLRDSITSAWREATEYEQPIWGWIIINYADGGLQFFRPDGTFYQEVRMGGVTATNVGPKWVPGETPAIQPADAATAQLAELIAQFSPSIDKDGTFLQSFFDMINGSIQNMPFPPSDYSGYANAIVGKPLALVNVGWSIELAAPAIMPQNSLPYDSARTRATIQAELEQHTFPVKIGDLERSYDGVVGYYLTKKNDPTRATDFSTLYSYFVPNPTSKIANITPTQFPGLNPYYHQPESTPSLTAAREQKYTVTSLIIDPYTPLHGYSPILPTKTLTLPPWTIQSAFQKMHAFFHLGPNLVTHDVPKTYADAQAFVAQQQSFKLPVSGRKGTWQWLQPYVAQVGAETAPSEHYVALDVQEDLGDTKFEAAPYTLLEGYLQLMGSLAK